MCFFHVKYQLSYLIFYEIEKGLCIFAFHKTEIVKENPQHRALPMQFQLQVLTFNMIHFVLISHKPLKLTKCILSLVVVLLYMIYI